MTARKTGRSSVRNLTVTAMLGAVASVLMFISFSVPLMPSFIKLDFSELPALLAAFALGPWHGVTVCLIKNPVNVLFTTTGGVGELSNFLLGACFVIPAGLIYRRHKSRGAAIGGAALGALCMAVVSVFTNYFVIYPVYAQLFIPMDTILELYRAINPGVKNLWQALICFNLPFTFVKGMCSVAIAFIIYKPLSPILKGRR